MFVEELVSLSMKIMRGHVVAITAKGEIIVEDDAEGIKLTCDFLRTSSAPPPRLNRNDAVVYVMDGNKMSGYIVGVIEKYQITQQETNGKFTIPDAKHEIRELKLNAEETIELRCGKSSITMNKEGKMIIKGTNLTSRASEVNKIKGGAVRIN